MQKSLADVWLTALMPTRVYKASLAKGPKNKRQSLLVHNRFSLCKAAFLMSFKDLPEVAKELLFNHERRPLSKMVDTSMQDTPRAKWQTPQYLLSVRIPNPASDSSSDVSPSDSSKDCHLRSISKGIAPCLRDGKGEKKLSSPNSMKHGGQS